VLRAGADERALGGRSLSAHEQHFAQRVPERASSFRRGAAAGGCFSFVVFPGRRVSANEGALRVDPLAVGRRDLSKNRDGFGVFAGAQRFASFIDVLCEDWKRGEKEG
jgi:hypothetical protein